MKNNADQNAESPEKPTRRWGLPRWVVVLGVCLLALAMLGVGRHFYLGWREKRLIRGAWFYLPQADKQAELRTALDRVLQLNPNNVEAFRISGQALLKQNNPKALPWLRRAIELAPDNLNDQIVLADATLLFNRNEEALKVVREIEPKARGRADFQDLAGRVMQSLERYPEAEAYYAEAVKLDPNNSSYRLHLAIIRLNSDDAAVREAARKDVVELSPGDRLRAVALRALAVDAVRSMQTRRALTLVTELDGLPGRLFNDRLMRLEVLHLLQHPDFQKLIEETQEEAARTPGEVLPLLSWMNNNNLSLFARDWAQRLPQELTAPVGVRIEMARSYFAFGDWKNLRFFLADEKWGDLDYLKFAYLSRCYRELDQRDTNAKSTWVQTLGAAGSNGDSLIAVARMAMQWGWEDEASDALWQAVTKSNKSSEALNALCQFYYSKRNTPGLLRAYTLLVDRNPNDSGARNNLVIFSLLLGKDKTRALNTAHEIYEKEPANPAFASTYAFALYCTESHAKALEVMKALKPAELREPSIAAYYSAILTANGDAKAAQEYRELAKSATLLPEEEQILNLMPIEVKPTTKPVESMENPALTPAP